MFPILLIGFVSFFYILISYLQIRWKYKFADKLSGPGLPVVGLLFECNGMDDESMLIFKLENPNLSFEMYHLR